MRITTSHQYFVTVSKSFGLSGLQILTWVGDGGNLALISSIFCNNFASRSMWNHSYFNLCWFLLFSVFLRHGSYSQQGLDQPSFKIRSENKAISKIRYKTRWKASAAVKRDQQKRKHSVLKSILVPNYGDREAI